jgi:SAM-dependent methyltransferase
MHTKLTDVQFWDNYWAGCKLPSVINYKFSFERCLAYQLNKALKGSSGEILEIGCAPGKWLAFAAQEIGLKPSGIEYSKAGMEATLKNFSLLGIEPGFVEYGDFFAIKPRKQFDVVMSLGFIEHFDLVDKVVEKHIQWLKNDGHLVLAVPNFRGIYYLIQNILDRTLLDKHNLQIMNLAYFNYLASNFNLTPLYLGYIGSFEPTLPIATAESINLKQFVVKNLLRLSVYLRRIRHFDYLNSPTFSSCILAVYQRH